MKIGKFLDYFDINRYKGMLGTQRDRSKRLQIAGTLAVILGLGAAGKYGVDEQLAEFARIGEEETPIIEVEPLKPEMPVVRYDLPGAEFADCNGKTCLNLETQHRVGIDTIIAYITDLDKRKNTMYTTTDCQEIKDITQFFIDFPEYYPYSRSLLEKDMKIYLDRSRQYCPDNLEDLVSN